MDFAELAEYLADEDHGGVYNELLILDIDTNRPAWWACNLCGLEIPDRRGCPEHAPQNVPGLERIDCDNDPPHAPMWVLASEANGYGIPCHQCMYERTAAELAKAQKRDRCYHWPWRSWALTKWVAGKAYTLGIVAGTTTEWGGGHDWCITFRFGLRSKRTYILGVPRTTWRCWLIGHHRRGEEVGFGFCGKCVPWTCCGSQAVEHADGCAEDTSRTAVAA